MSEKEKFHIREMSKISIDRLLAISQTLSYPLSSFNSGVYLRIGQSRG